MAAVNADVMTGIFWSLKIDHFEGLAVLRVASTVVPQGSPYTFMVNPKTFTIEGTSYWNLRSDHSSVAVPRSQPAAIIFRRTHCRFELKTVENYVYVKNVIALDP
jgi:hypothetical protein